MKKIQYLAATALAFLATACSNEVEAPGSQSGAEAEVTITLGLPSQIRTYAYGDGTTAQRLQYAVYEHQTDGTVPAPVLTGTDADAFSGGNLSTTLNVKLITGVEYDLVFFADNAGGQYEFDAATATVTDKDADDGTIGGNMETRDAFFGVSTIKVTGPFSASVELKRPFAQLNLGTNDLDAEVVKNKFGENLANLRTSVKAETYKSLNLITGDATDKVTVTFGSTGIPSGENFPVTGYEYLSMNYLLMPAEMTRQNCEFSICNGESEMRSFVVLNVPVQRNYRTNVYGTLITTDGEIKVDIKPEFMEPDHAKEVVVIADGVVQNKGDETKYIVSNVNGLSWISEKASANISDFAGKTIELGADIDMGNIAIQPIKLWSPEKPVTFDGAGHTIKNVKFQGKYKSLIESTTGTVKNLNIDGMNGNLGDDRRFCGVVANSYGNFENVHVKNVKLSTRDGRIGAIVGIHNGGSLINCSVENAEITGAWSVGGMAGAVNETPGFNYTNCVVKNVKVTNTHGYGGVYDKMAGVIVGNINIANVIFTDCQIIDCDTELPIYNSFVDYTWNGTIIKADIDENTGNPITTE